MKKLFQETYGKVQAPEDLKAETLALMNAEHGKGKVCRNRTKQKIIGCCGSVAAVFCAVFIGFSLFSKQGPVYITPMEDGVHYDRVELEDGVLNFWSERVMISVTPNGGNAADRTDAPDETVIEEDVGPRERVISQSGGTLVYLIQEELSLPEVPDSDWSFIDDQRVYVTVLKTENIRYQATFEKEGRVCEITGEGVTQKEFIDFLYKKIKE